MGIVAGSSSDGALAALLTSPDKMRAELQRLEKAREEADARIALAGQADEIVRLREEAALDRERAAAELREAKARAEQMAAMATEAANAMRLRAEAELSEAREVADRVASEIRASHEALDARRVDIEQATRNLESAREQLEKQKGKLAREIAEAKAQAELHAEKRAQLAAIADQVKGALDVDR